MLVWLGLGYSPEKVAKMTRRAEMGLPYEDPLTYLPRKAVQEFAKGRIIYDAQKPATDLYVVILGRVKITTTADDGGQTVGRIVRTEGLFGESSLIGPAPRSEMAVALDNTFYRERRDIGAAIFQQHKAGFRRADFGDGRGDWMFLTARNGGGVPQFSTNTVNNNLNVQSVTGNAALPTNQWVHIAVTFSNRLATLYVNGLAVGSNADMDFPPYEINGNGTPTTGIRPITIAVLINT